MSNLLSIQPCRRNLAKEVELKLDGRQYLYRVGPMRHVHCGYNDSWTREMRSGEVIPKEHNGDYLYLTHTASTSMNLLFAVRITSSYFLTLDGSYAKS